MDVAMVSVNAGSLGGYGPQSEGELGAAVAGLAGAVRSLGHAVTVFERAGDGVTANDARPPGAENVVTLATGTVEELAEQLARHWSLDRPDVVHAFDARSCRVALAAVRGMEIPVVATLAGLGSRGPALPGDGTDGLVRACARIVALSSAHVFALMTLGAQPRDVRFVPFGIDTASYAATAPAQAPGERRFRIATLGALGHAGGVADVIEALPLLGGVELVIGGGPPHGLALRDDPTIAALDERARILGVADRVHFAGAVGFASIPAFFTEVDLAIAVPRDDALGTVALSAMAAGVPPIVSSVGAHIDIVADGMTGIHVPPSSPRAIADAIRALQSDSARRERYARFGAERARVRYDWTRIAPDLTDIYTGVQPRAARLTRA